MKFQDEKSAIKSLYFEMSQQLRSPKQIKKLATKLEANVEFQIEFERRANKDNGK